MLTKKELEQAAAHATEAILYALDATYGTDFYIPANYEQYITHFTDENTNKKRKASFYAKFFKMAQ